MSEALLVKAEKAIAKVVEAHNQGFNLKFGRQPLTVTQRNAIQNDKRKERERIRSLP